MTDDNKVVIKIKYQGKDKIYRQHARPEMVTEWHIKRILIALCLLLSLIAAAFYFFNSNSSNAAPENISVNEQANAETKLPGKLPVLDETKQIKEVKLKSVHNFEKEVKEVKEVIQSSTINSTDSRIIRAVLTTGLTNKEPEGVVTSPVYVSKDNATGLYYYTEIIDMKGQRLYHHWLRNNRPVFKKEIKILGDRWRASTSKLIPYSKFGTWIVRLLNEDGVILNEIEFQVIQQE